MFYIVTDIRKDGEKVLYFYQNLDNAVKCLERCTIKGKLSKCLFIDNLDNNL